jgi:phytoene dehydrogenase-like protein
MRPFRGLRDQPPRPRYDAVVIGAGVGGLVCANLLACRGLSVLLAEQHYMVGGYCSTFRRGRFTFDASTHFYPLLGNPSTLTGRLLADLGMETRWVKMDPVDTFHFPDGSRFDVPADFETYLGRVKAEFPAEAAALDRFFAEVREAYHLGLVAYFRWRTVPRLDRFRHSTVRQVLDRHFASEKLKLLLTADCPHWGSPPCRTSFVFDSMLRLSYFLGNYYPVGGSQAFADELARRFEELGGHILTSSRVEQILLEDGAAAGVEVETTRGALAGRRRIRCEIVVSNADLRQTYDRLLPRRVVDPGLWDQLASLRVSYPCFLTHLGVKGVPPEKLAAAQGYYWRLWDPDRVGRDALVCKIFVPTLYEPAMAPPGGQVVILQKVLEMDYRAVADWAAHKAEVEALVTGHLERVVPEVSGRIVVKTSATARTAWRFTGNLEGSMLGWEMAPDQLGAARPGIEGPVPGLYLVGHWVQPGGGITPVIISALRVAQAATGSEVAAVGAGSWTS